MDIMANFGTFLEANRKIFSELHVINKGLLVCIAGYAVIKVTAVLIKKTFGSTKLADDPSRDKYDRNKVYLHVFPRSLTKNMPNNSPYVMKLETWLRMANINYEVVETMAMSRATKQIPYIFHKGKEITDSNLIIDYLSKEFEIDVSEGLNEQQQAISRAFSKMVDDSTFWCFVAHAVICDPENTKSKVTLPLPKLFRNMILNQMLRGISERVKTVGIGRKPAKEIYHIGKEDLRAISTYLGDKKFLMGDQMTRVDCVLFGQLSVGVYCWAPSPFSEYVEKECKNIGPYLERIKGQCWPDWKKYSDITF